MLYRYNEYNKKIELEIYKFLSQNEVFFIPRFQRFYSWKLENVLTLLDYIEEKFNFNNKNLQPKKLFLGLIILKEVQGSGVQIIDGQQRILTMMMILKEYSKIYQDDTQTIMSWTIKTNKENKNIKSEKLFDCRDKISFRHISDYVSKNTHKIPRKPEELKQIINLIQQRIGEWENSTGHRIYDFLKTQVTSIILYTDDENGRQQFNTLNSNGVSLTLTDQCYAFLIEVLSHQEHFYDENEKLICYLRESENKKLIETFINIYLTRDQEKPISGQNQYFRCFQQVIEKDIKCFFKFLKIYYVLYEEQSDQIYKYLKLSKYKSFYFTYLRNFCWDTYWPILIAIILFEFKPNVLKYFLETFWKVDLINYLIGVEKSIGDKYIIELVQNIKNCRSDITKVKSTLVKFYLQCTKGNKKGAEKTVSVSKDQFELVSAVANNNKYKLIAFYWLLFRAGIDTEEGFKDKLDRITFKNFYSQKVQIEHIIPIKARINDPTYSSKQLQRISNLILVTGDGNSKLSNKPINQKITEYIKDNDIIKLEGQRKLIIKLCEEFSRTNDIKLETQKFWKKHLEALWKIFAEGLGRYLRIDLIPIAPTKQIKIDTQKIIRNSIDKTTNNNKRTDRLQDNYFDRVDIQNGINNLYQLKTMYQTEDKHKVIYFIKNIVESGHGREKLIMPTLRKEFVFLKNNQENHNIKVLGVIVRDKKFYVLRNKNSIYKSHSLERIKTKAQCRFNTDDWTEWKPPYQL